MKKMCCLLVWVVMLSGILALPVSAAEATAAHTHEPSEWRTTGVYHYKVCTTCGDFLEQEDHVGGVATCSEKGKCTVCGYEYMEENENHAPDTTQWVAREDMYHYHRCIRCGAHCDAEDHRWSPTYLYQDDSGHAWICADCKAHSPIETHIPGPAATETTAQTCKACGYILASPKKHEHDLSRVPQTPATCMEGGNIEYYFCTGCNDCFTDAGAKNKIPETMSVMVGALGHTPSEAWSRDARYHWRTCSVCSAVLEETRMIHEGDTGTCATCGYVMASGERNTEPSLTEAETAPAETAPKEPDLPKGKKSGISWFSGILIGISTFGAAVTATVIVLKMRKK